MNIDIANTNDIKELVNLRIEYLLSDYKVIEENKLNVIRNNLPTYFMEHLNKDLFAYVCRNNNEIIGCAFLYVSYKPSNPSFVNGRIGTVMNAYVKENYRKQGIGKKLLESIINKGKELDLDYIDLQATEDGYNLYKIIGFVENTSKYRYMKYMYNK
jgi:ribosomal protein S18 acetylase RimI-like enzyme